MIGAISVPVVLERTQGNRIPMSPVSLIPGCSICGKPIGGTDLVLRSVPDGDEILAAHRACFKADPGLAQRSGADYHGFKRKAKS